MLGVSRSIPRAHDTMRRGEWAKKQFSGNMLSGKVLGVVGFGSVGREASLIILLQCSHFLTALRLELVRTLYSRRCSQRLGPNV